MIFGLIWVVLSVINVLKLDITQTTICIYCLALLFFNGYSYYRCSKVQKDNLEMMKQQYGAQIADNLLRGSFISAFK